MVMEAEFSFVWIFGEIKYPRTPSKRGSRIKNTRYFFVLPPIRLSKPFIDSFSLLSIK
jgi:hypothetical protein